MTSRTLDGHLGDVLSERDGVERPPRLEVAIGAVVVEPRRPPGGQLAAGCTLAEVQVNEAFDQPRRPGLADVDPHSRRPSRTSKSWRITASCPSMRSTASC